ncbi:MAG: hypothetical protein NTV45_02795 [Firmicutes bacterium]|nr:hypothetical protein [Bacillota bacterium]
MANNLNIYKSEDQIIIEDDLDSIEIPYTPELWERLNGEKIYDDDDGWMIDGIELASIIQDAADHEMENMFIGTIQADGIDERRELYVAKDGANYKIVGMSSEGESEDTEIISESLKEAILNTQENWASEEWDLQLSDEAVKLLKEVDEEFPAK